MGYRSKVAIRTTLRGFELIKDAWEGACNLKLLDSVSEVMSRDGVCTLAWREVKWDDDFPEVLAVDLLLQRDELQGEPWCFVRCGEEVGDFEQLYSQDCPDEFLLWPDTRIIGLDDVVVPGDVRELEMVALMLFECVEEKEPEYADYLLGGNEALGNIVRRWKDGRR